MKKIRDYKLLATNYPPGESRKAQGVKRGWQIVHAGGLGGEIRALDADGKPNVMTDPRLDVAAWRARGYDIAVDVYTTDAALHMFGENRP
jgi:hypothetical protein